jgi:hypothetical protein
MLLALLAMLFLPPTTCLQLIAFFAARSWKSAAWLVLAQLVSQVAVGLGAATLSLGKPKCARDYMVECFPSTFAKAQVDAVIPESARKDLELLDVTRYFRKISSWEGIQMLVVNPAEQARVSASLSAFKWSNGCFVFLPASPENLSGWHRFAVLHEMGHGAVQSGALMVQRAWILEEFMLVAWMFFLADWTPHALTVCVIAMVTRYAVRSHWNLEGTSMRHLFRDERHADQFAIKHATKDDLADAYDVFTEYSLPDERLSAAHNDFRNRCRLRDIGRALRDGSIKEYELPLFVNAKRLIITNVISSTAVVLAGQRLSNWKAITIGACLAGGAYMIYLMMQNANGIAADVSETWTNPAQSAGQSNG